MTNFEFLIFDCFFFSFIKILVKYLYALQINKTFYKINKR